MPRRPRIHIDAVPLHIVQRGHNRQPCFFAEEDYHTYLTNDTAATSNEILRNMLKQQERYNLLLAVISLLLFGIFAWGIFISI